MITRKKLIEVALPLEKINIASAKEKQPGIGAHPRGLHLWWARRPLAAARAVIFAQMVDDPSGYVDELLSDPGRMLKAQATLNERLAVWQVRKQAFDEGTHDATDPGLKPTLDECAADNERERLFALIEQLVLWENTTNEDLLNKARNEIWKSWRRTCAENRDHSRAAELFNPDKLPAFHDPFAGGGALPLEAQRLGLESYASDLNPVAVLINKAMIEIPPKFAGQPPVNPGARGQGPGIRGQSPPMHGMERRWKGAQGLAEDVRYYGQWMRDEAEKRIGHLYPKVEVTAEMAQERPDLKQYVGQKLTVITWLWARTVKSPNPAFAHVDVPLASTFILSTKDKKESYVEPVIEGDSYRFTVKVGKPRDAEAAKNGTKVGRGGHFQCIISGSPMPVEYIREQGIGGTLSARMMAIVAEGANGRIYFAPDSLSETTATMAMPSWMPDQEINHNPRDIRTQLYGLTKYSDLFTPRQLVALNTFSELVGEAREQARHDALAAGLNDDGRGIDAGGRGAAAYADAVGVYLSFALSRTADYNSSIATWKPSGEQVMQTFKRQAIPMTWDFPESNLLGDVAICWKNSIKYTADNLAATAGHFIVKTGHATQDDSTHQNTSLGKVISTDPPYYDNIGYADLSDFFYVWLRRSLRSIFPDLFATVAVPKAEELVATPYRHGGKQQAEQFFLDGMTHAMQRLAEQAHPVFPVTIYYAFKQSEADGADGVLSTGWETFLDAVIHAGFALSGTWPMRTELSNRMIGSGTNALASSIVLVCRPRPQDALTVTRRDFLAALKDELPLALANMQRGNIAPVDLAQASIGPGMAVFTRYGKVLDASGKALSVREALALINATLDEVLAEQEGDFDADTRWALAWFEQSGFSDGEYGVAETLSKAKNTSVASMVNAGLLASKSGKVRLLRPDELPANWDPTADARLTVWEMVHHLVRALAVGELAAAELTAQIGPRAEIARELAYRLYAVCERKKRAAEALAYNGLVQSWPEILRLAQAIDTTVAQQSRLEL